MQNKTFILIGFVLVFISIAGMMAGVVWAFISWINWLAKDIPFQSISLWIIFWGFLAAVVVARFLQPLIAAEQIINREERNNSKSPSKWEQKMKEKLNNIKKDDANN